MMIEEASTTEAGKLFHAQTTLWLSVSLSQLKPTSLNLYFETVTTPIVSTTIIQLKEVFHFHLINSLHYTISHYYVITNGNRAKNFNQDTPLLLTSRHLLDSETTQRLRQKVKIPQKSNTCAPTAT